MSECRLLAWRQSTNLTRLHQSVVRACGTSASAQDHYDILGVTPNSKSAHIKQAYYELSKKYHPDSGAEHANAQRFHQVAAAYDILGNKAKKKAYDKQMHGGHGPSAIRSKGPPGSSTYYNTEYDNRPFNKEQYARDFDFDYRSFIDFQSKMREKQNYRSVRMAYVPQDVWDDLNVQQHDVLNKKHTSAFYRGPLGHDTMGEGRTAVHMDDDPFVHDSQYKTGHQSDRHKQDNTSDPQVKRAERVMQERRRAAMPTFEELHRMERMEQLERQRLQLAVAAIIVLSACIFTLLVQSHHKHRTDTVNDRNIEAPT